MVSYNPPLGKKDQGRSVNQRRTAKKQFKPTDGNNPNKAANATRLPPQYLAKHLPKPNLGVGSALFCLAACLSGNTAKAQITLDNFTPGVTADDTTLTPDVDNTIEIGESLGLRPGNGSAPGPNLFHSFAQFGIGAEQVALFTQNINDGSDPISNVIARVSGGELSLLDGLLRSNIEGADFWLVNPAGVMFGEDAAIDVGGIQGGSFNAGASDFIVFANGERLGTSSSDVELSVSNPVGFGFLDEGSAMGQLSLNGTQLVSNTATVNRFNGISLSGHQIEIDSNSAITTQTGTEISGDIGVHANDRLIFNGSLTSLDGFDRENLAGNTGGSIHLSGSDIQLDGAQISSLNNGRSNDSGLIQISATGNIEANQDNATGELTTQLFSYSPRGRNAGASEIQLTAGGSILLADTVIASATNGDGQVSGSDGDITLSAQQQLALENTAVVTRTTGDTPAGDITLTADVIQIQRARTAELDESLFRETGLILGQGIQSSSGPEAEAEDPDLRATGDAGNVMLIGRQIELADGANVSSSTFAFGDAGNVYIDGEELISIKGIAADGTGDAIPSTVSSISEFRDPTFDPDVGEATGGSSGDVELQSNGLIEIVDSEIVVSTRSHNPANVEPSRLSITGDAIILNRGELSSITRGFNDAGSINIEARTIDLDESDILSFTGSGGNAGSIEIVATDQLSANRTIGVGDLPTRIAAESRRSGDAGGAGQVVLRSDQDILLTNTQIAVSNFARDQILDDDGNPIVGEIELLADNKLEFIDSGAVASTRGNSDAGDVSLRAPEILIDGSARVSEVGGTLRFLGDGIESSTRRGGSGGIVRIIGDDIDIRNAVIQTNANAFDDNEENPQVIADSTLVSGAAGNVIVRGENIVITDDTHITSSANSLGDAGSITINGSNGVAIRGDETVISSESTFRVTDDPRGGASGDIRVLSVGEISIEDAHLLVRTRSRNPDNNSASTLLVRAVDGEIELDGAVLNAISQGSSPGGQLRIVAENIELNDTDLLAIAANEGNGGSIVILATGDVSANLSGNENDETRIAAESLRTNNAGAAGRIDISADGSVQLTNTTLSSATFSNQQIEDDAGNPLLGTIDVEAGERIVLIDSGAAVTTAGAGAAGNIVFSAPQVELIGQRDVFETGELGRFLGQGYESSTTGSGNAGDLAFSGDVLVFVDTTIASTSRLEPDQEAPRPTEGMAGDVTIEGRIIRVTEGSVITASATSFGDAGSVVLNAAETLEVLDSEVSSASTYRNDDDPDDPRGGGGGSLDLQAGETILLQAANISTTTSSRNPDITTPTQLRINAADGSITSTNSRIVAETEGLNPGGQIDIEAGDITLDGSLVSAITRLSGNAGSINIAAQRNLTANASATGVDDSRITEISSESLRVGGAGAPGSIKLSAGQLVSLRNTAIASSVFSNTLLDSFGTVDITAGRAIQLIDSAAAVNTQGNSNAGDIFIQAPDILVQGSRPVFTNRGNFDDPIGFGIEASTTGQGHGGNIVLEGDNIVLSGAELNNTSEFRPDRPVESATGNAGNIVVNGLNISVIDGTTISAEANALGDAGSVLLSARDELTISGTGTVISSESLLRDEENTVGGAAGQVTLTAGRDISITDAMLSVRTRSTNPNNNTPGSLTINSSQGDLFLNTAEIASDTSGTSPGGSVFLTGGEIQLNNSDISAYTANRGNGGSIEIRARGSITSNLNGEGVTRIGSGSRRNNNAGAVGSVVVHADEDLLLYDTQLASSSFSAEKRFEAEGDSSTPEIRGNIDLSANNQVELVNSAVVTTTQRSASAGDINISGQSVLIRGSATATEIGGLSRELGDGITASANSVREGDAGNISIDALEAIILENTLVAATAGRDGAGSGLGGSIALSGENLIARDGTQVSVQANGRGNAGNVELDFQEQIRILDTSTVVASTTGEGNAGSVLIDASSVELIDGEVASTSAFAETRNDENIGQAGDITVNTNQLVLNNGRISSSTAGAGTGGNISINTVANASLIEGARIETQAEGAGNSGSISLNVNGDLILQTEMATELEQLSSILTNSSVSDGGSITANIDGTLQLDNGRIVSSVDQAGGTGGDVIISAGGLLLESGQILAQAAAGNGGAISIERRTGSGSTQGGGFAGGGGAGAGGADANDNAGLFLIDANSLVNADSEAGVDGAVDVSQPDTNANLVVVGQDIRIENPPEFSDDVCGQAQQADTAQNTLVVQTRESISPAPDSYQVGSVLPDSSSAKAANRIASVRCSMNATGR